MADDSPEVPKGIKRSRDDEDVEQLDKRKSPRVEKQQEPAVGTESSEQLTEVASGTKQDGDALEDNKKSQSLSATAEGAESREAVGTENDAEEKKDDDKKKGNDAENEKDQQKDEKKDDKIQSKPVFGSGFSFGSTAFGSSVPKTNVFDTAKSTEEPEKEGDATAKPKPTPIFGSGFSFGSGAFGSGSSSGSQKNVFDSTEASSTKKQDQDSESRKEHEDSENSQDKDQYVQLKQPLEAKPVETGEEGEKSVFTCECALYALLLSETAKGWKERGRGTLHLNTQTDSGKSRLVMRSRGVLKVILNVPLLKNSEVLKGMKSSLSGEKFVRFSAIENNEPLQFAIRVGSKEIADDLYDNMKKLIPE